MARQATSPRCSHRSAYGLGCAGSAGHTGSHWLTAKPEAARADLAQQGFFSPAPCAGCAACDPAEAARDEAVWADWD